MVNQIESEKLLIKDIFKRWYKIPNYQRPYVWEKDQISELLDDISYALQQNEKAEYFLGSTVFQTKKNEDNEYVEDDVLDGQQRLTTLFILTATIRDLTENIQLKESCKNFIFRSSNPFEGIPERIRIIFDIREEVKGFVNKFLKTEGGTSSEEMLLSKQSKTNDISIINMINAILVIRAYFQDENCKVTVEQFFMYLSNKVILIYVASENLEDSFRMFTILNSRGVKLRNSDILKAENLRLVPDDDQLKYAKYWEEVENYFKEDFDVFLSHLRTILVKEKARLNLYDEFQKNIYNPMRYIKDEKTYEKLPQLMSKGQDTINFIIKYKNNYDEIFNLDHSIKMGSYQFDNLIAIMQNVLPADFWVPPLLLYYEKYGENELLKYTEMLDNKFSYDWIIGLTPTSRIENMNNIMKAIEKINVSNLDSLFSEDIFKIDVPGLMSELEGNIYGRRFARYILYKLDYIYGSTDKINVPNIISAEHVLPQTPKEDSQWKRDFSPDELEKWTNKIGNLVLISRRKNSSQGRLDFDEKQKKYFKNNIELFRNSIRLFNTYKVWTPKEIDDNQQKVLDDIEFHYKKNDRQS